VDHTFLGSAVYFQIRMRSKINFLIIGFIACHISLFIQNPVKGQLPPRIDRPASPDNTLPTPLPEPQLNIQPRTEQLHVDLLPTLTVRQFRFIDSTVIPETVLQSVVQPYLDKKISMNSIYEIEDKLNQLYQDKGYVTSGASIFIKDNSSIDINNAVINIRIIEGEIGTVKVVGSKRLTKYIQRRLYPKGKVIQSKELQKSLRLLIDDPLFKKFEANLIPAKPLNRSDVVVKVEPSDSYKVSLFADNYRNCNVGCIERGVDFIALNPTTLGDKLSFTYINSNGSDSILSSYSLPLNSQNTTLNFDFSYGNNSIIAFPANILDIRGSSQSYALSIHQPILRLAGERNRFDLGLGLGIQHFEVQNTLLGLNFPVSRGADNNGFTKLSVLDFAQDATYRDSEQIASVRSEVRLGVNLDASTGPGFHNGNFLSFKEEGFWTRKITHNTFFSVRIAAQYAATTLPSTEQLSLGGIPSVPGYPQDAYLADYGLYGGVSFTKAFTFGKYGRLFIGPIFNVGYGGNNGSTDLAPTLIAAPGLEASYEFNQNLFANLTYAIPLFDIGQDRNSLQGSGLYLSVKYVF
jgi:hemolysin activation/secretion protein